jgi:eukaryotic-like serine/threonine-protein kinase
MMTDEGNAPTVPDSMSAPGGAIADAKPPDPRYVMGTLLGRGGMGEVWLARDERIDREIAIKMMRAGTASPDAVARFLREARVQGRLEHPSVVPVHDLGGGDTAPYFAMKRLSGTTLAEVLASRDHDKWPRRTLLARFVDVCLAIEFAHQRGVVHRDLKPANLMLGDFGEAYVLDWGLARIDGDVDSSIVRNSDRARDSGAGHTEAGAMLGTPGYMSPEQVRGESVDARTDVFALGSILFEILSGTRAIGRLEDTLTATEHRPSRVASDVPPELDDACAQATAASVSSRLVSARALADRVQRFLDGDRDLERRRELAAARVQNALQKHADESESRAHAMREAGSALALDPANRDAQAILARLLLEPPNQIPPEAARKIDDERQRTAWTVTRGAAFAYSGFLIPIPISYALGVSTAWPLILISIEVVALMVLCISTVRNKWRLEGALAYAMVVGHCVLLATIGVLLGPLLLVPNLLFGSSTIMVTIQTIRMPVTLGLLHASTLVVPLSLELLGVLPSTFSLKGGALILDPWAVDATPTAMLFVLLATVGFQLAACLFVLDSQRRLQDKAQEQLHVQAWQLGQLVPSSGLGS